MYFSLCVVSLFKHFLKELNMIVNTTKSHKICEKHQNWIDINNAHISNH